MLHAILTVGSMAIRSGWKVLKKVSTTMQERERSLYMVQIMLPSLPSAHWGILEEARVVLPYRKNFIVPPFSVMKSTSVPGADAPKRSMATWACAYFDHPSETPASTDSTVSTMLNARLCRGCRTALSVRVFNSLKRTGITTIGDVLEMLDRGPDAMLAIRNFGEKSLDELRQKMDQAQKAPEMAESRQQLEQARSLDPKAKDLVFNLGIVHDALDRRDPDVANQKPIIHLLGGVGLRIAFYEERFFGIPSDQHP